MALKWGSTTIGSDYTVKFNGTEVTKIYWGSTLVWEKATSICTYCGGDGYAESDCYECYTPGGGKCANCQGLKYTSSGNLCSSCLGLSCSYLCTGCGVKIYISSFKKAGTTDTIDWSKSYTCGNCNSTYTNLDEVNTYCRQEACKNDVSILGYATGSCRAGTTLQKCTNCNGTGNCPICEGTGEVTVACPVCNGGGGEGGDTSSD